MTSGQIHSTSTEADNDPWYRTINTNLEANLESNRKKVAEIVREIERDEARFFKIQKNKHLYDSKKILEKISRMFGVTPDLVKSAAKDAQTSLVRHLFFYVATQITEVSNTEIARTVERSRTALYFGIDKIQAMVAEDEEMAVLVANIAQICLDDIYADPNNTMKGKKGLLTRAGISDTYRQRVESRMHKLRGKLQDVERHYWMIADIGKPELALRVKQWLARYFAVPVEYFDHSSRKADVVYARHLYWWLMRTHFAYTLSDIVCASTVTNHTTIMSGVLSINNQYDTSDAFRLKIETIVSLLIEEGLLTLRYGLIPTKQ